MMCFPVMVWEHLVWGDFFFPGLIEFGGEVLRSNSNFLFLYFLFGRGQHRWPSDLESLFFQRQPGTLEMLKFRSQGHRSTNQEREKREDEVCVWEGEKEGGPKGEYPH